MKKVLMLFILVAIKSFTYFQVAPSVHTIDLDKRRTSEVYVINESDKLVRVKIYAQRPDNQKSEEFYMGNWMVIYPKLLYLKPKGKKKVRFGMRLPKELEDGEYRSYIVFEELSNKEVASKNDDEGMKVTILTKIIGSIYGNKGEISYKASLKNFKLKEKGEKKVVEGIIVNEGTGSIKTLINLTYLDKNSKKIKNEEKDESKVIRENENALTFDLEKIPTKAKYLLIEVFHFDKGEVDTEVKEKIKLAETNLNL